MNKTAYFALFAALAIGPQAAVAQVADTVPAQRQQRMEMRNQRMADRMGQNHQRMASRRQVNQQRMQPGMRGGMQQGCRGFCPSAILRQQQSLGLAPEQVTQLEALRDQTQSVNAQATTDLTSLRQELADAWAAEQVDPDLIGTRTRAVLNAQQTVAVANAEATARAQALLTDEQRGRVLGRGDAMRGRSGMQGRRGMRAQVHRGQNRSFRGMRGSQRGRGWRPN
jgi:hypothetical protein